MRNLKRRNVKKLEQSSNNLTNFKNLKEFFRKTLVLILFLFATINTTPEHIYQVTEMTFKTSILDNSMTEDERYVYDLKIKMKAQLVLEVQEYIQELAPTSKLDADYLVTRCLEYDTDIIFVLSQGLLESHFGTKGTAIKTNSVWNVGTWDDGQIRAWFAHPNESVDSYLKLINKDYLINVTASGDTIYKDLHYLLKDRGYVNYKGMRYATSRGYENGLRKLMIQIDQQTTISFYQDILKLSEYEILAFFKPSDLKENDIFYALN